ncbi:glycosyltransferase [Streptomyces sp. NPDC046860]|uniref:glycosyltransferase n=1 Tax=Streptomyces sp. NPDC046860 TaxID=3154495 RepID=UPI0033D60C78
MRLPTAHLASKTYLVLALLLLGGGIAWTARHVANLVAFSQGRTSTQSFTLLWAVVFGSLVWHLGLAWTERPFRTTARQQAQLDKLFVTVNVPVHKEDEEALRRVLEAILRQTRMPQRVQIVTNGLGNPDYSAIRDEWTARAAELFPEMIVEWVHQDVPGKRDAQIRTFKDGGQADIFATMDSDTVMDPKCIEEGLKPFADKRVTSVASVILAFNSRHPLVRITDPWLLAFQLAVRSAMSKLGCVLVNSGNFSMYRAQVVRDALPAYEREYFLGNQVQFSDDSLLTLFAHLRGRTVQQPSSFAFTVLPEKIGHHWRQQLRWMRGSTIRSIWRFRYLPLKGFAYWEHFAAWLNFVLVSFAFLVLFVLAPIFNHEVMPFLFLFSVLVAYATGLKYLTIRRSDQSFGSQLVTFALTPVMLVWTALVLRPLRIYAMVTCWKTGWGTRGSVEVRTAASEGRDVVPV